MPLFFLPRASKLRSQEGGSLGRVGPVAKMRSQNSCGQVAIADSVADKPAAEDLIPVTREVGDLATVLAELGVTKADCTLDLVLDLIFDILNAAVNDGCSLAMWRALVEGLHDWSKSQNYL